MGVNMSIYDLEKIRLNLFVASDVDEKNFNWMLKDNKLTKEEYASFLEDYKAFLKRYKVLNEKLSFKEPISIYALFVYMVNNGFLSKDKSIEFKAFYKKYLDMINLYGINIFNGNGVCRHLGSMLTDVLRESGIESYHYSNLCSVPALYALVQKYYKDAFNYQGKLDYVMNKWLVSFLKVNYIYAPHLISYASYNGKNYFLDPTQERILKSFVLGIADENGIMLPWLKRNGHYDLLESRERMCDLINQNNKSLSNEEVQDILIESNSKIIMHKDMFEDFYNENKAFYEDMSLRITTGK